ncbi:hypothetical protein AK812_SmicGene45560 [Symbiodinium microadriaticum]|uniref:Uncharacterized protein n=1 Tax=Symbiodinium microadriaticum TaxID=2951 RepID=A0A1Q9BVS0_SYMMI|nr:hypothetical protein AK812_SmicGene45560 [Symbiodinium microadriaticum]
MSEHDAEKAAHKLFREYGLTMDIPISWLQLEVHSETLSVPFLKPSDFLSYLLQHDPDIVWVGGVPQTRCLAFWRAYYQYHPTHMVFQKFSAQELEHVIPIMLHGDEGSGSKKQPVSIVNFQTVWGTPNERRKFLKCKHLHGCRKCIPKAWVPCCKPATLENPCREIPSSMRLTPEDIEELEDSWPTTSDHSYLSRHLCCILPTYMATKGAEVLDGVLQALAKDVEQLFQGGICIQGRKYYAALIGCKGDAKWHVATAKLFRSYLHLGSVADYEICPYCLAGHSNHPFEDCSSEATWVSTLYSSAPWHVPGPFESISYDPTMPAAKYKRDPLHVFKIGLARDIIGSLLILLIRFFKIFDWPGDKVGLMPRLHRAHGRFMLWCRAQGEIPHFRSFTKDFLHMKNVTDYPYTGSKGSDSMILIRWLSFEIALAINSNRGVPHRRDLLKVLSPRLAANACLREALQVAKAMDPQEEGNPGGGGGRGRSESESSRTALPPGRLYKGPWSGEVEIEMLADEGTFHVYKTPAPRLFDQAVMLAAPLLSGLDKALISSHTRRACSRLRALKNRSSYYPKLDLLKEKLLPSPPRAKGSDSKPEPEDQSADEVKE